MLAMSSAQQDLCNARGKGRTALFVLTALASLLLVIMVIMTIIAGNFWVALMGIVQGFGIYVVYHVANAVFLMRDNMADKLGNE